MKDFSQIPDGNLSNVFACIDKELDFMEPRISRSQLKISLAHEGFVFFNSHYSMKPHLHKFAPDWSHPRNMKIESDEKCLEENCTFTIEHIGSHVRRLNGLSEAAHRMHSQYNSGCWECMRIKYEENS